MATTRARPLPEPTRRATVHRVGGVDLLVLSLPADQGPLAALTRAEAAVAELAICGLSNAEIAAARGTSVRTVANQLANVFRKVGVGSRLGLAERLLEATIDEGAADGEG